MHKKLMIPFTKPGYEKFKHEYEDLLEKRPALVTELARARDLGDRSENAAYKSARWSLSNMDYRLRFLKKLMENGKVVQPKQTESVEIGSTVRVKHESLRHAYTIVGEHEADPLQGRLSYKSPIGSALIGKQVGDQVMVKIPAGSVVLEIVEIEVEG